MLGGMKHPPPQQKDTRGKYCILVNEPGFYELVFKSRLPSAKIFRQWVLLKFFHLSENMVTIK